MANFFDLTGRTAVVTGASKGLGRAFAKALAAAGASVFGLSRDQGELDGAKDEIAAAGGVFEPFAADILDESAIQKAVARCLDRFGPPDALVNNAGLGRVNKPFEEITTAEWRRTVDNNVTGTFICSKYFGLEMIRRKRGKIVNLASMSGLIANKGVHCGPYEVSKLGIVALTRSLASEWCAHGVTVNALAPGYIATKRNSEFFASHPEFTRQAIAAIPVGKIPTPDEIAGVMVFLCSSASDYMNGAVLVLDGGYTIW
ncbi:MAG: SDR family oxidoreductase [Planctomycetota bacterium]|jgi:NAD(P)-dependent dehydrogenase (short-subunit alcohol dehydrogenase family)|nr:SDR family oxidoreductase [Planctomycetota bacterium]